MKKVKRLLAGTLSAAMVLGSVPYAYAQEPAETSGTGGIVVHTDAEELYVSPSGSDSNPGTYEEPLQTIAGARDKVRGMNDDMEKDIVVYLRGGTYTQTETLEFTKEDSGTNGHMITYKAYGDEKVVVSGGHVLTDWELADEEKGIYKTVYEDAPEDFDTRQLYVNGTRATRARGSLEGAGFNKAVGAYTTNMDMLNWKNPKNIEFVYFAKWTAPRVLVESIEVDTANPNRLLITMNPYIWTNATNKGSTSIGNSTQGNTPQWIENAYELLDEPGEWYLDKTGAVGGEANTFYYKPLEGEDMETAEIITPVLEELMTIKSDDIDEPASNIQFEGISFQYATWLRPNQVGGVSDGQDNNIREETTGKLGGDMSTRGNIFLNCTRNIVFQSCEFARMGNAAVYLHQGNKDCLINGCHFYDISAQAVKIGDVDCDDPLNFYLPRYGESTYEPGDPRWYTVDDWDWRYVQSNNDVTNNIIHDTGREFFSSSAIGVATAEETDISHNEIYNTPYAGLHVGYGWGGWKDMMSPMGNNKLQYNYIHDIMQVLYDAGGIYLNGSQYGTSGDTGYERKSIISDNYITRQVNMYGAVYLDDGANYYEVTNNVVQDCPMFLSNKHPRNDIHDNYSNQTYYTNTGATWDPTDAGAVHDNTFVEGDNFPEEALEIMRNAGVEDGYSHDHFDCEMVSGEVSLEYNASETEYPLTFTTKAVTGVKSSDQVQLYVKSDVLAGQECKVTLGGSVLTGVGDDNGKVYFGDPILVEDIPEILGREGLALQISLPSLPDGKTKVAAGWEKVEDGKNSPLLSTEETLCLLTDFTDYDLNLEVDLDEYDLGKIPPSENPDNITYNDALGVTLEVEDSEDGRYIRFNKPVATGSSYTWDIPVQPATSGTVVVKAKLKPYQTNAKVYGISIANSSENFTGLTYLHEGRIVHEYGNAQYYEMMDYEAGKWYDMTMVLNMDKWTYDVMINGRLVKEGNPICAVTDKQITRIYMGMFKDHTGSFDIKDIAVYSSKSAGAALSVTVDQDDAAKLDLSVSNTRYIPEGAKGRFRVTMPEEVTGDAVFEGILAETDTVAAENGVVLSSTFDLPGADDTLDASVQLPLGNGTYNLTVELLYELDGELYSLGSQNVSTTVVKGLQTIFQLNLDEYDLAEVTADTNNPDKAVISGNPDTATIEVVEEDGERALKFSKTDNTTALEMRFPVEASGRIIEISADVKIPASGEVIYTLIPYEGENVAAYLLHNANQIAMIPYRAFGSYPINQWHNVKLRLDMETKTYSILVNDELRGSNIAMETKVDKITEISTQVHRSRPDTYFIKNLKVEDTSAADGADTQTISGDVAANKMAASAGEVEITADEIQVETVKVENPVRKSAPSTQTQSDFDAAREAYAEVLREQGASDEDINLFLQLTEEERFAETQFDALWTLLQALVAAQDDPGSLDEADLADELSELNLWLENTELVEKNPLEGEDARPAEVVARVFDRSTNGLLITVLRGNRPLTKVTNYAGLADIEVSSSFDKNYIPYYTIDGNSRKDWSVNGTSDQEKTFVMTWRDGINVSEIQLYSRTSDDGDAHNLDSVDCKIYFTDEGKEPVNVNIPIDSSSHEGAQLFENELADVIKIEMKLNGRGNIGFREVKILGNEDISTSSGRPVDGNWAVKARSYANSVYAKTYFAMSAVDGQTGTDWASNGNDGVSPKTFTLTWDEPVPVKRIEVLSRSTDGVGDDVSAATCILYDAEGNKLAEGVTNDPVESLTGSIWGVYEFEEEYANVSKVELSLEGTGNLGLSEVRVLDGGAPEEAYIQSVENLKATVEKGADFVLPETVEAHMSDGTTKDVPVTWDKTADTDETGTFIFNGTIEGYDGTVTFTLTVEKPVDKTYLQDAYDYALTLDTEDAVDSAKAYFDKVVANAKTVLDNADATQTEVDKAWSDLIDGIHGLGIVKGDKTFLKLLIDKAEEMMTNEEKYIPKPWPQLVSALEEAQKVYENGDALEEDIEPAAEALHEAILAQRYKAAKENLADLIEKASALDLSGYTEESVQILRTALKKANTVLEDENLSTEDQAQVDQAEKELNDAIQGLVKSDGGDTGDTGNTGSDDNTDNNSNTGTGNNTGKSDSPKTGDNAHILPWLVTALAALAVCGAGAVILVIKRKTNKA